MASSYPAIVDHLAVAKSLAARGDDPQFLCYLIAMAELEAGQRLINEARAAAEVNPQPGGANQKPPSPQIVVDQPSA